MNSSEQIGQFEARLKKVEEAAEQNKKKSYQELEFASCIQVLWVLAFIVAFYMACLTVIRISR